MISDNPDPNGPSIEGLRRLRDHLPSMVKGMATGKIGGKGIPVIKKPTKCCRVCGKAFDLQVTKDELIDMTAVCPECQSQLDEGFTALVAEGKFAFIRSPKLADYAGKVMPVSIETLTEVKRKFDEGNTSEPM